MLAKRTSRDATITTHGGNIDNKIAKVLGKKYTDSFQCRISFKRK